MLVVIRKTLWPFYLYMSQCMRFPTIWYVRPAKPQISLRIRAVWSEPLLVAWVNFDCKSTDSTPFGVSKLKRRLQRLVRVYTCQNVKLLEISCCGSYSFANGCCVVRETLQTHMDRACVRPGHQRRSMIRNAEGQSIVTYRSSSNVEIIAKLWLSYAPPLFFVFQPLVPDQNLLKGCINLIQ